MAEIRDDTSLCLHQFANNLPALSPYSNYFCLILKRANSTYCVTYSCTHTWVMLESWVHCYQSFFSSLYQPCQFCLQICLFCNFLSFLMKSILIDKWPFQFYFESLQGNPCRQCRKRWDELNLHLGIHVLSQKRFVIEHLDLLKCYMIPKCSQSNT